MQDLHPTMQDMGTVRLTGTREPLDLVLNRISSTSPRQSRILVRQLNLIRWKAPAQVLLRQDKKHRQRRQGTREQ